jgi:hypothetical protein
MFRIKSLNDNLLVFTSILREHLHQATVSIQLTNDILAVKKIVEDANINQYLFAVVQVAVNKRALPVVLELIESNDISVPGLKAQAQSLARVLLHSSCIAHLEEIIQDPSVFSIVFPKFIETIRSFLLNHVSESLGFLHNAAFIVATEPIQFRANPHDYLKLSIQFKSSRIFGNLVREYGFMESMRELLVETVYELNMLMIPDLEGIGNGLDYIREHGMNEIFAIIKVLLAVIQPYSINKA